MISLLGIFSILVFCYLISHNRKSINWRIILAGLALQAILAFFILGTDIGQQIFIALGNAVDQLIKFADAGGRFAFGDVYDLPGYVFAVRVSSAIIFICALFSAMSFLGLLHPILKAIAFVLQKIMPISGAELLANIASAFIGQVESALPLRPYFGKMTNAQFFTIMVGGMSTMSISLLAVYASFGIPVKYLLAANVMGIPAGIVIAKLIMPSNKTEEEYELPAPAKEDSSNLMDAIVHGAQDGLKISMAIISVVIAVISVVALLNYLLGFINLSLAQIFGYLFFPLAILLGSPLSDASLLGSLIGEKIALNEFIAFAHLAEIIKLCPSLSEQVILLSSFAICGFANFGSVAIQLGAFTEMLPARRKDFAQMGMLSMVAGALASCLSACWANLFFTFTH